MIIRIFWGELTHGFAVLGSLAPYAVIEWTCGHDGSRQEIARTAPQKRRQRRPVWNHEFVGGAYRLGGADGPRPRVRFQVLAEGLGAWAQGRPTFCGAAEAGVDELLAGASAGVHVRTLVGPVRHLPLFRRGMQTGIVAVQALLVGYDGAAVANTAGLAAPPVLPSKFGEPDKMRESYGSAETAEPDGPDEDEADEADDPADVDLDDQDNLVELVEPEPNEADAEFGQPVAPREPGGTGQGVPDATGEAAPYEDTEPGRSPRSPSSPGSAEPGSPLPGVPAERGQPGDPSQPCPADVADVVRPERPSYATTAPDSPAADAASAGPAGLAAPAPWMPAPWAPAEVCEAPEPDPDDEPACEGPRRTNREPGLCLPGLLSPAGSLGQVGPVAPAGPAGSPSLVLLGSCGSTRATSAVLRVDSLQARGPGPGVPVLPVLCRDAPGSSRFFEEFEEDVLMDSPHRLKPILHACRNRLWQAGSPRSRASVCGASGGAASGASGAPGAPGALGASGASTSAACLCWTATGASPSRSAHRHGRAFRVSL